MNKSYMTRTPAVGDCITYYDGYNSGRTRSMRVDEVIVGASTISLWGAITTNANPTEPSLTGEGKERITHFMMFEGDEVRVHRG